MEATMISNVYLKYFKCFSEADISFAPLTLLTGLNSSGKSSLIQAIRIAVGGKLLDGYGNCVSIHGSKAEIVLNIGDVGYSIMIDKNSDLLIPGDKVPNDYAEGLHYLCADRLGPSKYLPFIKNTRDVGTKGEYVLSFLDSFEGGVPEKIRRNNYDIYASVKEQTRAWLEIISPGQTFDFKPVKDIDIAYSTFSDFHSIDVGFGLSYTLPIIVLILSSAAKKAESPDHPVVLLIENPEAHLHPRGQTELGIFLSLAAACGVQVIVETHSDHIINGVRIAIKNKQIEPDNTVFHFFKYDIKKEESIHYPIFIDENGVLDYWPDGFFDETEKSLFKIL
jgi:predicted ATPase